MMTHALILIYTMTAGTNAVSTRVVEFETKALCEKAIDEVPHITRRDAACVRIRNESKPERKTKNENLIACLDGCMKAIRDMSTPKGWSPDQCKSDCERAFK